MYKNLNTLTEEQFQKLLKGLSKRNWKVKSLLSEKTFKELNTNAQNLIYRQLGITVSGTMLIRDGGADESTANYI